MKALAALAKYMLRLVPLAVFLLFWQWAARHLKQGEYFYGSPWSVGRYIAQRTVDGSLLRDLGVTSLEAVLGFIFGTLLGTALGTALAYWPRAAYVARPYVTALGVVPIFALAPILVIWFGISLPSKVIMAILSTVFVAMFQAYEGVRNVDEDYIFLMKTMRATRPQIFRQVVFPSAVCWVIAGMRLNVGFAILGAFIGEYIASDAGLGHMIVNASGLFNIPLALAGVVSLCVLALVLVFLVGLLERALTPWRAQTPFGLTG